MIRQSIFHKRIIWTAILVSLFALSNQILAQDKLSGVVYDQNGEVLDGAVVSIFELDTISFIDYTLANAQGEWSIDLPTEKEFLIEFSMFGYRSVYKKIDNPSQYAESMETQLVEEAFNLEEVTVKDRGIGVAQRGDTLNFSLEYFTTGAERTLGDVIKRLPGLEVRDGSVYYGGEKITKMLVQGRDIINNNHKLATEGIRADQLSNIQIIENYKDKADQFETEDSEDVAMDVQLKDDVLNKWSGEIEVLGGYPSSGKGNINAFNLGSKLGLSAFVRANNVGEEVLSWRDIQDMVNSDRRGPRHIIVSGNATSALLPSGLRISEQVQSNRDGIINLNMDYEASDNLQIKGMIIGAYAERKSEVFRRTEYLSEGIVRAENSTTYSETPIASMAWKLDYQMDSLTFMSFNLPLSVNKGQSDYTKFGEYGDKPFKTISTTDDLNYLILPNYMMRRKVGEKGQWSVDMNYNNTKISGSNFFRDDFPFLGVPISGDSLYSIYQDRTRLDQNLSLSSKLKLVKGDWFVEPYVGYIYDHNQLVYDTDKTGVQDFGKSAEMFQHSGITELRGGYETDDWELAPSVTLNYLNRHFVDADHQEELFTGYGFQIVRKFTRAHSLRLNADYGLSFPSFNQVQETYEIQSATGISTGGILPDVAQKTYSANLSYNNFNPVKSRFMFSTLSYSYSDDVISGLTQQYGDYMLSGSTIIPFRQSFNWMAMVGGEIHPIPIRVTPNLSYNWSEGFSAKEDANFLVENNSYSASLRMNSTWKFPLNVSLSAQYNYNTSVLEGGRKTNFSSWFPSVSVDYSVDGFEIGTRLRYNFDEGGGESTELYLWNINASYELNKVPLRFSVVANNILNLQPTEKLVNSFGVDTNSFTRYMIFPGYIIGGVTWTF